MSLLYTTTKNHYEKLKMPAPPPKPQSLSEYIHLPGEPKDNDATPPFKISSGRTRISNRHKYPSKIEEDLDNIVKLSLIKIPAGNDVVDSLINVALHHQSNITILGGCGLVSDVTFHNSVSQAPALTIHGSFQMTSITGTYFISNYGCNPSEVIIERIYSSFSIFLTDDYGKVFGGVVVGEVKAASDIQIMATLSKKPEFYRGPAIDVSIREVEDDLKGVGGVTINVDHIEPKHKNTHSTSNYGVTDGSSTHPNHEFLSPPPGYENVMRWNH